MENEREIGIVIRARDEFSSVMESAGACAEESASRIKRSFGEIQTEEAGRRLDEYASGLKKVRDLEASRLEVMERTGAQRELARLQDASPYADVPDPRGKDIEAVRVAASYEMKLAALQSYNTRVLQEMIRAGASQAEIEAAYAELSIAEERKKRDFQIAAAAQTAGVMANFMQNLYVATGSKNRALFEMMKAFSIARAMISGTEAVVSSYAWGAYFGGPALGAAFAAVAAAATAAQIAQIASMSPAGASASIGASGAANPQYAGGSPDAYPVPARLSQDSRPVQNVTIQIYNPLSDQNWQKLVEDNIVPALNNAADRNVAVKMNVMN